MTVISHGKYRGKGKVTRFYRMLYRIRRTEEAIARIYPSDKIKSPVHLSIGQEAVSAGVCAALRRDDAVFGTYRGHAMYLAKGGDLKKMIAELYGKETGCARGKGGSMHLVDAACNVMGTSAVVGTTIPLAVGYSYAMKLKRADSVTACFFGDGAVDEGAFHESMNIAALKGLPVLFVCENNLYAIHSHHLSRHHSDNICERAKAYGIDSARIDDGNVFTIYDIAKAAVDGMRKGKTGPFFMECITCRWKEHVGPGDDFDLGYRSARDIAQWKKNDQLMLLKKNIPLNEVLKIEKAVENEIEEAFAAAERAVFPAEKELYSDVLAD